MKKKISRKITEKKGRGYKERSEDTDYDCENKKAEY